MTANAYKLTPREQVVLALVAERRTDKRIGRDLGISADTARKHVQNIRRKMGASCRTDASVRALRAGLLA